MHRPYACSCATPCRSGVHGSRFTPPSLLTWLCARLHPQVASGAAQALGFARRVYASYALTAFVGLAFLAQDAIDLSVDARRTVMMALAALVALSQVWSHAPRTAHLPLARGCLPRTARAHDPKPSARDSAYAMPARRHTACASGAGAVHTAVHTRLFTRQVLLEPALFGLASTLPSGAATQAMMVGNATAGVLVSVASVVTRLAAGGANPSLPQLRVAARLFFGLQLLSSLGCTCLFRRMLRGSQALAALAATTTPWHLARPTPAGDAACAGARSDAAPPSPRLEARHPSTSGWWRAYQTGLVERTRLLAMAARAVRLPALCQLLVFAVTLASWPSIPGAACAEGWLRGLGGRDGWWFTVVVTTYNLLDFAARLHLRRLQRTARRVSARACVLGCLARLALPPLIVLCVKPRLIGGVAGNLLLLLLIGVLAVSNGFLATASMMQVARLAPAGLQEEAVYVAVAGVYLGLASGATTSWVLAHDVLRLGELHCP